MTVGANVKGCYFTIKQAGAILEQLAVKTNTDEAREAFLKAQEILSEVAVDLEKQVLFLAKEEPQYK
ncbi:DUF1657 domain-containing protein [Pseudogracilibacillus auburnensis]|uniref:Uncharacterized protein DUF1657 n=1 Tax=Pseudogracilibacillus auburnensis TaxID=1494959 RepID=A0A2V3W6R9_9BACI|nr:DUF1657 domain-containing protein [Pseudogracilibacillus auburnensis]MBO1003589.1 DUF1657 domain-containing protein [Pseudogracilibacillus auburnensis]PXW89276.1 uncharacterized protein DUF1657 [Pseudogracilibacillus auburnensis]